MLYTFFQKPSQTAVILSTAFLEIAIKVILTLAFASVFRSKVSSDDKMDTGTPKLPR